MNWIVRGQFDEPYEFSAYGQEFVRSGGIYIFAQRMTPTSNHLEVLYVGRTHEFSERFSGHEKLRYAQQVGIDITHILVWCEADDFWRTFSEESLITRQQPVLNEQFRIRRAADYYGDQSPSAGL